MSAPIATTNTAADLPFYLWKPPGKSVAIELHFGALDRILQETMRGFGALPRRGAEVGGILIGKIEPGATRKVIVKECDIVPCEYSQGPSYNLSDKDLSALAEALEKRSNSADLSVVGFFRSHTRKDLYMDDADLAIYKQYFSDPENVFLLVKPFATRSSLGGFFFREDDGEINCASSYLEFPFSRRELGGGDPPQVKARREEKPAVEKRPAKIIPIEEPRQRSNPGGLSILSMPDPGAEPARGEGAPSWKWLWGTLALAILLAGGVAWFLTGQRRVPRPVDASPAESTLPLKLAVVENNRQLEVTWNLTSQIVTGAQRGVLSIHDGPSKRDLELSGAQLRFGRVLYSRLSGDVSLRLEVFGNSRSSVTESVRFVSTDPGPAAPQAAMPPPVTETRSPPTAARTSFRRRIVPFRQPDPPASTAESEPAAEPAAEPEVLRPARRR